MKLFLPLCCAVLVVHSALAQVPIPLHTAPPVTATNLSPLTAPAQPQNMVQLSVVEQLGKDIFYDSTLSNPQGYSCATCHIPESGFTGPSSLVNQISGPVPGVIHGRFGRRKPQAVAYSTFSPTGPYLDGDLQVYLGGNFWDGRAADNAAQSRMPFLDANEMANTPVGPFPPVAGGYSPLVAEKLKVRPYARLFQQVYGFRALSLSSDDEIYDLMSAAIAAYEASAEINPFSSKFDNSKFGTPPRLHYRFSPSEENGRELFFGKAQCFQCHSSATLTPVLQTTHGKNTFTMYCYANIGVPKNPENPFYSQTDDVTNPNGYNPLGVDFVDFGLGANPNPAPDGTVFMNHEPGDITQFRGLFKAPSLRNVDKRPNATFVKSFMHNGVFKSLEEVVHFYNKRNIATNSVGTEVAFDWRSGPPAGYTAIFPPPEVFENAQNIAGYTPINAIVDSDGDDDGAFNGQVGNLQLTAQEETDVVNFLKTLTDGFNAQASFSP